MAVTQQTPKVTLESRANKAKEFFQILFEPEDFISLRPMKAAEGSEGGPRKKVLYKKCRSLSLQEIIDDGVLEEHLRMLDLQEADGYFGVCPRAGSSDKATYELQWQIPMVRFLWADIDDLRGKSVKVQLQIVDERL